MPTTIPYDPSLVIGNIVPQEKLDNLVKISELEAPVNAAEDTMNSYIAMKRSVDMTIQNLVNMSIDPSELKQESEEIGKNIEEAAKNFAKTKLAAEKEIQPLKAQISTVGKSVESPLDYGRTQTKKMPLSADSFKMNCQYFTFDKNKQSSDSHASTVASFVSDSFSENFWGSAKDSFSASESVRNQVNSQHSRHSIAGTLVVSINCTHKNALLLSPLIFNTDKAVRCWNALYPDDSIKVEDQAQLLKDMQKQGSEDDKKFNLLSGATYGSCFVGMVHVLNTTDTSSSERMYSVAESLQDQFTVGGWFCEASGSFGVNSSFSNDAKNLLSSQKISSHCTITCMGLIPSIKSNAVKIGVEGFTNFDGAKSMKMLAEMQNANANDINKTVKSAAEASKTGAQMISMENAKVTACLSGLSKIDEHSNKMIDTNTLMDAIEDYVNKCAKGDIGIPINYYLKPVTKAEIVGMYLNKYYPNNYVKAMDAGDSTSSSPTAKKA